MPDIGRWWARWMSGFHRDPRKGCDKYQQARVEVDQTGFDFADGGQPEWTGSTRPGDMIVDSTGATQIVPPRRIPDAPLYHPVCTCPRLVKPDRSRDAQMWDPGCPVHFTMEKEL